MNVIHLVRPDDRKTLEVVQEILAYAHRELGTLSAPAPDLDAAVANALQLTSTILGEAGSGREVATQVARPWIE